MKAGNINNARDRRASLPARSFVVGMISALVLAGLVGAAARAKGHLIITNRSGRLEEFDPGDAFVIPKGWAGTWNMTARFKKQYAAFEAAGS